MFLTTPALITIWIFMESEKSEFKLKTYESKQTVCSARVRIYVLPFEVYKHLTLTNEFMHTKMNNTYQSLHYIYKYFLRPWNAAIKTIWEKRKGEQLHIQC